MEINVQEEETEEQQCSRFLYLEDPGSSKLEGSQLQVSGQRKHASII